MWRAMGISLVRRLTYTYELAAVAQWGDGPTPGWVPRVRAVIDGELGPFDGRRRGAATRRGRG